MINMFIEMRRWKNVDTNIVNCVTWFNNNLITNTSNNIQLERGVIHMLCIVSLTISSKQTAAAARSLRVWNMIQRTHGNEVNNWHRYTSFVACLRVIGSVSRVLDWLPRLSDVWIIAIADDKWHRNKITCTWHWGDCFHNGVARLSVALIWLVIWIHSEVHDQRVGDQKIKRWKYTEPMQAFELCLCTFSCKVIALTSLMWSSSSPMATRTSRKVRRYPRTLCWRTPVVPTRLS